MSLCEIINHPNCIKEYTYSANVSKTMCMRSFNSHNYRFYLVKSPFLLCTLESEVLAKQICARSTLLKFVILIDFQIILFS